jgi:hypothetical protein
MKMNSDDALFGGIIVFVLCVFVIGGIVTGINASVYVNTKTNEFPALLNNVESRTNCTISHKTPPTVDYRLWIVYGNVDSFIDYWIECNKPTIYYYNTSLVYTPCIWFLTENGMFVKLQ